MKAYKPAPSAQRKNKPTLQKQASMPSICRASSDHQQHHHHNHRGKGDRWAQAAWGGGDGGSGYYHHHRRNRRFSRDGWIPWNPQERTPWRTMQEDEEFEEVKPKKKKNQRRRQQQQQQQQQHGKRPRSPPSSCHSPLLHIRPHSPPPLPPLPPPPPSSSSSTPFVVTAILTRPTHWVKVASAPPPLHPSTPFHLYNHLRHPCEKSSGSDLAGSVTKDGWTTLYKTDGRKESDSFSGRDGSCWFTTFYSGPQGKERAIMKVYHEDHMLPELRGMVEWYKGEKGKEDMFFRGPVGQAPPPSLHGPW